MTVSEQIIQVLDMLCEKFGIVINWTSENIIPYVETLCKKLATYEIATSIASIIFMLILVIASIIAIKTLYPVFKKGIKNEGVYEMGWSIGSAFAIFGLVILYLTTIIVFACQITDIVKCATFPEMYVLEYIDRLMNGV